MNVELSITVCGQIIVIVIKSVSNETHVLPKCQPFRNYKKIAVRVWNGLGLKRSSSTFQPINYVNMYKSYTFFSFLRLWNVASLFKWRTVCRFLVMSETIFVNFYWRQHFHENLQIILPEGAVVVAENLQKKRSHTCNSITFSSCKQRTPSGSTTFAVFLKAPLFSQCKMWARQKPFTWWQKRVRVKQKETEGGQNSNRGTMEPCLKHTHSLMLQAQLFLAQ